MVLGLRNRLARPSGAFRQSLRGWWRRRFSRAGRFVAIAGLAAGLLGLDTTRTMAYQLCALTAGLLLIARLQARRAHPDVSVTRRLPRFATAGEPLRYQVAVTNRSGSPLSAGTLIDDCCADGRSCLLEHPVPTLPPGSTRELALTLRPRHRGVMRWSSATLARPDPLGLIHDVHPISLPQSLLVLPRRYAIPHLTLPGSRRYQEAGLQHAQAVGESEEFLSLRDYRLGDPLRALHWRSWARLGRPIVKEHQEEFLARHALILDTCQDPPTAAFEEAVSVAASFACSLDSQDGVIDLLFVARKPYCVTVGRGLGQVEHLLEVLTCVAPSPHGTFAALDRHVRQRIDQISGAICVWLAFDAPRQALVARLCALGVPVLALVIVESQAARDALPHAEWLHGIRVGHVAEDLASV